MFIVTKPININNIINILYNLFYTLIIIYVANNIAHFGIWLIYPSNNNIYVANSSITDFDNSVKFLMNIHPFGVIVDNINTDNNSLSQSIKLTGLYADNTKNSFAFFTSNNKTIFVKLGDSLPQINPKLILNEVGSNYVILKTENGETIKKLMQRDIDNTPNNENDHNINNNNSNTINNTNTSNNINSSDNNVNNNAQLQTEVIKQYVNGVNPQ